MLPFIFNILSAEIFLILAASVDSTSVDFTCSCVCHSLKIWLLEHRHKLNQTEDEGLLYFISAELKTSFAGGSCGVWVFYLDGHLGKQNGAKTTSPLCLQTGGWSCPRLQRTCSIFRCTPANVHILFLCIFPFIQQIHQTPRAFAADHLIELSSGKGLACTSTSHYASVRTWVVGFLAK